MPTITFIGGPQDGLETDMPAPLSDSYKFLRFEKVKDQVGPTGAHQVIPDCGHAVYEREGSTLRYHFTGYTDVPTEGD